MLLLNTFTPFLPYRSSSIRPFLLHFAIRLVLLIIKSVFLPLALYLHLVLPVWRMLAELVSAEIKLIHLALQFLLHRLPPILVLFTKLVVVLLQR